MSFHAVCRFFSHHAWDTDRIGLTLARLLGSRLLAADAAIEVVVDDTLFRRWGPKVFGAFWTRGGAAQDPNALGRGNRWIIIGIVVTVPFCSHPVCLPVLLRLWRGKGTASPVQLARELISILAHAFPDRLVHAVGDAAYHGKALLLPANAALCAVAGMGRQTAPCSRNRLIADAKAPLPHSTICCGQLSIARNTESPYSASSSVTAARSMPPTATSSACGMKPRSASRR